MSDAVERVAKAIEAKLDETSGGDFTYHDEGYRALASAAIEASGYLTLEAALRTIRSSIPGYLKGEITADDFALVVLENADSAMVNKALGKGK